MERLSKKTTILLTPDMHGRLSRLAEQRDTSLGELVRSACARAYGVGRSEERIEAVRSIAALELPVGTPAEMKRESVPEPEELGV